jgi:hypothetical protein
MLTKQMVMTTVGRIRLPKKKKKRSLMMLVQLALWKHLLPHGLSQALGLYRGGRARALAVHVKSSRSWLIAAAAAATVAPRV